MTRRKGGAVSIAFRDILYLIAFQFMLMFVIVLPALNPPAAETASTEPPGQMVISAVWPEGNIDVDLWVMAPGEKKAVGYSNRGGKVMNLLRDDMGDLNDDLPMNYESAFGRGLPAGEYTVNLHLYRGTPVGVAVEIRFGPVGDKTALFFSEVVQLAAGGQERTVVSFRLDEKGRIVPGSVNRVFKPLRSGK